MASYENRFPQNAPGQFYVDDQCIDCDLCRERLPEVFLRNDNDAHSYVGRQPRDEVELALCYEALEDCPIEAIGAKEAELQTDTENASPMPALQP